ncbi:MAG: AtpZ/AtpI family protein [Beijerinckiaceae bacterium]|nr:AtpZ/AtpI family protein [Beijerinckiaceae bacterium]
MDPDDKSSQDQRLASLKAAIRREADQHRDSTGETAADGASAAGNSRAMSTGFRVATELVANVCVGGLIGWQLDKWIGTEPILLLVFLLLGVASGFWSVYRIAMRPTKPTDRPR